METPLQLDYSLYCAAFTLLDAEGEKKMQKKHVEKALEMLQKPGRKGHVEAIE